MLHLTSKREVKGMAGMLCLIGWESMCCDYMELTEKLRCDFTKFVDILHHLRLSMLVDISVVKSALMVD